MQTFILLTDKTWHDKLFEILAKREGENWVRIEENGKFSTKHLLELNPKKIFIPHWSHIIPKEIFGKFECIVFHMTDLPYGRGGSPLQNLIVRGHKNTMISALKVDKGIDTGDIYCKQELTLHGSAKEIFIRGTGVIFTMIENIIDNNLQPILQEGEIVNFKRRKPEQGNLEPIKDLEQWYDYIRMLDAPGYPNAFLEIGDFKLEFSRVSIESDTELVANVRIIKK